MYTPKKTDFELSPFTGLTRESWIEAGKYLLHGVFEGKKSLDEPALVKRIEFDITYPHRREGGYSENEVKAELFEGLTRTMLIAAPLIKCEPDVEICGIRLADYYKRQILLACDPESPNYIGTYEELRAYAKADAFACFQQTVETCALVIGLEASEDAIWNTYTKEEKDRIAGVLLTFAHGSTVPQNWRFFNMLNMAFLHKHGYEIDREIMLEHARVTCDYYAGDGWYRDGQNFDYYSCWAFQVYAKIWNRWYGREHMPAIAKRFDEAFDELMKTYPNFFDRDGFVNMWGRSNIYRFAAVSPFGECDGDYGEEFYGFARRITSGALLQFITRDDFLNNGAPTMGFYGRFSPLVQGYSCAESPFWFGKAFLCLALPKDHPFWTAKENEGFWEKAGEEPVENNLNGPALFISNHGATGETVVRTAKVFKAPGDEHSMWNYGKLAYNTKFPWEADSRSQQYMINDRTSGKSEFANVTFLHGVKDGVLYRRQFLNFSHHTEMHWMQMLSLADFPVKNGIVRADKIRLVRRPVEITLGSYGFPDNGTEIERREKDGARAVILKGKDHTGAKRQMALVTFFGWENIDIIENTGKNPDSEKSIVLLAKCEKKKHYGAYTPAVLVSACLTKTDDEPFTDDELFVVKNIEFSDDEKIGNYGPVKLELTDGKTRTVDYYGMESCLML